MAKTWLNDLKEGDIFWKGNASSGVLKLQHCGSAHNPNFKMHRIKAKILDSPQCFGEMNGFKPELFVNQYVYDNYDEAADEVKKNLKSKIAECNKIIKQQRKYINDLNSVLRKL